MAPLATITGAVWKLGDHVNTDLLHPPAFFSLDEGKIRAGLREGMERLGTGHGAGLPGEGLVIVAGENFGCGSSRETSVRSLVLAGVRAVVAASFARIFYRSLANLGIPAVVSPAAHGAVREGDPIRVAFDAGFIELGEGGRSAFAPIDPHIRRILECGGLIPYLREERR